VGSQPPKHENLSLERMKPGRVWGKGGARGDEVKEKKKMQRGVEGTLDYLNSASFMVQRRPDRTSWEKTLVETERRGLGYKKIRQNISVRLRKEVDVGRLKESDRWGTACTRTSCGLNGCSRICTVPKIKAVREKRGWGREMEGIEEKVAARKIWE